MNVAVLSNYLHCKGIASGNFHQEESNVWENLLKTWEIQEYLYVIRIKIRK